MNPLMRGVIFALGLEAAAVAVMFGALELATHSWGRFVAIGVALLAMPFLLLRPRSVR